MCTFGGLSCVIELNLHLCCHFLYFQEDYLYLRTFKIGPSLMHSNGVACSSLETGKLLQDICVCM